MPEVGPPIATPTVVVVRHEARSSRPATMAPHTVTSTSPTKEVAIKRASDWPCPISPVGDDRMGRIGLRVMNRSERDARVVTLEHHTGARRVQPEAETVTQ